MKGLAALADAKMDTLTRQCEERTVASTSRELEELGSKLVVAEAQIESLGNELVVCIAREAEVQGIADTLETAVRSVSEQHQAYVESAELELAGIKLAKESFEKTLRDVEAERLRLAAEIVEHAERNAVLLDELQALKSEKLVLEKREAEVIVKGDEPFEYSQQLRDLERQLNDARTSYDVVVRSEAAARAECQSRANETIEAIGRYEKELLLHAADVETLTSVKQQLDAFNSRLSDAQGEIAVASSTLETARIEWAELERQLRTELSSVQDRLRELLDQNNTLHDELQKTPERIHDIRGTPERAVQLRDVSGSFGDGSVSGDRRKSTENLHDVLRYVRREKEIAEAKFESLQAETTRLRQQCKHLKERVQATESTLAREREVVATSARLTDTNSELIKKVEMLDLLHDSNRLLRDERDRAVESLRDAVRTARLLEAELDPLKKSVAQLTVQRNDLQTKMEVLQEEVEEWKEKTVCLVVESKKIDPVEYRNALEAQDEITRQLSAADGKIITLRAEMTTVLKELSDNKISSERDIAKLTELLANQKAANDRDVATLNERLANQKGTNEAETVQLRQRIGTLTDQLSIQNTASDAEIAHSKQQILALTTQLSELKSARDADVSSFNAQFASQKALSESEMSESRQRVTTLETQLAEATSVTLANEADKEEKLKTIAQLRKIGRKYRMQAEEMQGELDDFKTQAAAAATASEKTETTPQVRIVFNLFIFENICLYLFILVYILLPKIVIFSNFDLNEDARSNC